MDTRLLRHYERELSYLREMGAEFATAYPKIAARLGIEGLEVLDPYVERLLEGAAFLTARTQLELELQFPALTQHLLEIVYPHFLAPIPSMTVVRVEPNAASGGLESGFVLPRGAELRSRLPEGEQTACTFRTSQDLTLWPLEIADASYIDGRGELVAAGLGAVALAKSALRLRLRRTDSGPINGLEIDDLTLFLSGGGERWKLHEILSKGTAALVARSADRRADWIEWLDGGVEPRGFVPEEALLAYPGRSFDGYRLLQEYFAMPERYFFLRLDGLRPAFARAQGSEFDLFVLFSESMPDLQQTVGRESFELHAVPAVNLFHKRCDRVPVRRSESEHLVIPDRVAPMDFEIHTVTSVIGIAGQGRDDVPFRAFYSADDFTPAGEIHNAYYAIRRRLRLRSEKQRLKGTRTSYLGGEVYLQVVDRSDAPYPEDLEQLAVTALCTNRDLPLLLSSGGEGSDFTLLDGGPVIRIKSIVGPTRPRPTLTQDATAWRLISHLSLNYLSVADTERGSSGQALRELLGIYAPLGERVLEKQLEGLISVTSRPIVRRLAEGPLSTAVRGLEVTVGFDEASFEGTSVYLLGSVLERFFARYVALNSFTETVIRSQQRGEIARWPATTGLRRLL